MRHCFGNGPGAAIRVAERFADASGLAGLECVDAQYYDPGQPLGTLREKGLITWTVRFTGLPPGPYDDGSVIVLVNLETGEARRLTKRGT